MYVKGKKRRTSSGLIVTLILSYVFLACFVAFFVISGVTAGSSVIGTRFQEIPFLFNFSYPAFLAMLTVEPAWVGYIFCGFVYFFIAFAAVYLIVGPIVAAVRKRPILINGILIGLLGAFGFILTASSYLDSYIIFKSVGSTPQYVLPMIFDILTLLFGLIVSIMSIVAFFKCVSEAKNNPGFHDPNENAQQQNRYTNGPQPMRPYPGPQPQYGGPMFRPLPENQPKPNNDKEDMKSMLREVVRDIVRDEIARNNVNQSRNDFNPLGGGTVTGATFGGPLVVQYFNGGINSPAQPSAEQKPVEPAPQPEPEPQPEPAPVVEEPEQVPQPEPVPVAEPESQPQPVYEEPAQFVEPEPQPEPEPVYVQPQPAPQPQPIYVQPEPEPQPAPQPEPVPAPVYVEPAPVVEPQPQPEPQPVVPTCPRCGQQIDDKAAFCFNCGYALKQSEPAPVVEPQPAPAPVVKPEPKQEEEKKPIIRIPFTERMINADDEMKKNYNELKNEILSYGVNSRVSNSGDTFRLHRKTYVKITIAGLSLKLYFALEPDEYKDSTIPVQNAGHKGIYNEIPLVFKVRSGLSMRRCKELIQDVMEKNGLEQGEVGNLDWVEDLRTSQNTDNDEE